MGWSVPQAKGGAAMFARVTRFNTRPESLEQGHHKIEEHLIPALRMQKGYSGGLLLANKEDHKMLAVTLWENEQNMHVTDEASHWFRSFGADAFDGKVKDVETYGLPRTIGPSRALISPIPRQMFCVASRSLRRSPDKCYANRYADRSLSPRESYFRRRT